MQVSEMPYAGWVFIPTQNNYYVAPRLTAKKCFRPDARIDLQTS
jgi:hypothetical protein